MIKKILSTLLLSLFLCSPAYAGQINDGEVDFFELDSSDNYLPVQTTPDLGSATRKMGDIYAGTLNVSGIAMSGDLDMGANDILHVDHIFGETAILPLQIGDAGTTSHSLASEDDLLVTGKLEVNGVSYFDSDLKAGYVYVGDGTTSLPSISFVNDPNTGLYSTAADTLGVVTGGSIRGYFSSAGSLMPGSYIRPYAAVTNELTSSVADGAGAIAVKSNSSNALANATSKIHSFQNNSVEKAYVGYEGTFTGKGFMATAGTSQFNNLQFNTSGNATMSATGGSKINLGNVASESYTLESMENVTATDVFLFNARPDSTENLFAIQNTGVDALVLDSSGNLSISGDYNMNFPMDAGEDSGFLTLVDKEVTASSSVEESIYFGIDHEDFFAMYADGDGAGGITNDVIKFFKTLTTDSAIDVTIADGGNDVGLTVTQNDTTNNPIAATITNAGTERGLFIDQNGDGIGLRLDSEAITNSNFALDVTTGQGARTARFAQNTGNDFIELSRDGASSNGSNYFYRNLASGDTAGPLVFIEQDNSGDDQPPLQIKNDGTAPAINVVNNLGWALVSGADTACNTTCTSACVFGQDSGDTMAIVGCADASADQCLCAGAS